MNTGLGVNSVSPFGTNMTEVDTPNFFNGTSNANTFTDNMTDPAQRGINNMTQVKLFDWFTDYIDVALVNLQFMWNLISGGFISAFLNVIGFPAYFINALYLIIGFAMFLWIGYKVTGKE